MNFSLFVLALGVTGWVWWRGSQARREEARLQALHDEYRRRIAHDPRNSAAQEALGDSLRQSGRLQEAHAAFLAAHSVSRPGDSIVRLEYKLRQLDLELRQQAERTSSGLFGRARPAREVYFCPSCNASNPPASRYCENCFRRLPADSFWEAFTDKETLRATAESFSVFVVIILLLRVFDWFPLDVKGVVIIATVIVLGWRFLKAIEGPRHLR